MSKKVTQEEVITLKLAKNVEARQGKIMTIGSTSKKLGGLTDEQFAQMREFGVEIAKQVGIEEDTDIVKECFADKEFQKELGLESEFCNEYWYIRREYEIAKYFAMKKEIFNEVLELMNDSLKEGVKDSFKKNKVYQMDLTVQELKEFVLDFETIKKELGV